MVQLTEKDLLDAAPGLKIPEPLELLVRPLDVSDQQACIVVEEAFTNPQHRAGPEKFRYRLSKCSTISYGLFAVIDQERQGETLMSILAPDRLKKLTRNVNGTDQVLLAHAISTMGTGPVITDNDMSIPDNWQDPEACKKSELGHQEGGRTVCLHSLAVIPEIQGKKLGTLLMKGFLRAMEVEGVADRVALLCQDCLVPYYSKLGYQSLGESSAQFGGGGWYDMVYDLPEKQP